MIEQHWAMRKRWLPELPPLEGFTRKTWQAPHPSPQFPKLMVWYTGYLKRHQLNNFLKQIYDDGFHNLIPNESLWDKIGEYTCPRDITTSTKLLQGSLTLSNHYALGLLDKQ